MSLDSTLQFFETSGVIRLLRAGNAPYVVHLLNEQYKRDGQITIEHPPLLAALRAYQASLAAAGDDGLRDSAETYLTTWSTGTARWLSRSLSDASAEPVYELTPEAEDVLRLVAQWSGQSGRFVGTESRLQRILQTLDDLVVGASGDAATRLQHLKQQRDAIDREITQINAGGAIQTYSAVAVRERFAGAVSDLTHLQADFRAVEEAFKNLTRDVQRRHGHGNTSRGEILGYALDQEDALKKSDHGASFEQFVKVVLSPTQGERLRTTIDQLSKIEAVDAAGEGMRRIAGMMPVLLAEAQKVLRTNQRLSTTLRRMLDRRSGGESSRIADVLSEIRQHAASMAQSDTMPATETLPTIELMVDPTLGGSMQRSWWSPATTFQTPTPTEAVNDSSQRIEAFQRLASMQRLDWTAMRSRLADRLRDTTEMTLPQIYDADKDSPSSPVAGGVVEVLGWIQIAHDDGHHVDNDSRDTLTVAGRTPAEDPITLSIPRIVFSATRGAAV